MPALPARRPGTPRPAVAVVLAALVVASAATNASAEIIESFRQYSGVAVIQSQSSGILDQEQVAASAEAPGIFGAAPALSAEFLDATSTLVGSLASDVSMLEFTWSSEVTATVDGSNATAPPLVAGSQYSGDFIIFFELDAPTRVRLSAVGTIEDVQSFAGWSTGLTDGASVFLFAGSTFGLPSALEVDQVFLPGTYQLQGNMMLSDVSQGAPSSNTITLSVELIIGDGDGEDPVPGDVDGDGVVDFDDVLGVASQFGGCADPADCPADLDGTGVVDFDDLLIVIANWTS